MAVQLLLQKVFSMSEPDCPTETQHPNLMSQPEIQSENQPPPVQPVFNQPDLSNLAPDQVQPHGGCPPQNDLPNPMPQSEGPAPAPPATGLQIYDQPPLNQSEPLYEDVQDQEEHIYMCPDPVPPPAVLQSENQPPPVQPVMNPSPINAAPYLIQPYKGYPVQSYLSNAGAQTSGPGPVSPPAGHQPQNQPLPVQTVMNLSGPSYPVQYVLPNSMPEQGKCISAYPMGGYGVPEQVPQPAELQLGNHPLPVQMVLTQPNPSTSAPHQVQAYAAPAVPPPVLLNGVPPGLEYLTQVDQILIHQKIACIKILTRFETNNEYEIKNSIGQEIYHAKEESDCLIHNIFGPARAFKMHITNHMDQEIIQMHRPMRCFLSELEVQAPPGVTIGYVKHEWSFSPKFSILGPNNEMLLRIQGPFLPFKCCDDIDFEVKGMIGEQSIGRITKQQSDLIKTCITDSSSFFIQFPMDMDVKMKAVLLGACLFIDILCFDKSGHLLFKLIRGS